jgi:phenylpropionate dioxygenase-like ring-hydroxylating dioxygenase large terminal subunit
MSAPIKIAGTPAPAAVAEPYSAYYQRDEPAPDAELTRTGPGTPLGEYMRRFWQPVCLSSQLTDVPHAIRIMGENLVAFRDRQGRVGVLQRHCCHRGASLEYGIVQDRGIRCCYHGMHFDVDGRILDAPAEADHGDRLRAIIAQGAYPAFEQGGLVFAYMGPPDTKPAFPQYDAFHAYADLELVPFSNVFPCNWLQAMDNIADQMHTAFLHNNMTVDGADAASTSLSAAFTKMPVMDYMEVRDGTAVVFIANRRVSDSRVWIRINDLIVPNVSQHAYLFEDGTARRLFHRVHMSRWYVPVDDTHSIIFGWRMFGDSIDPLRMGNKAKVGWDDMDFLVGQVGDRSYEEGQRAPGDWEAISSQRPIAIHALEHPMTSDRGVYMNRRIIRNAVRGKAPAATPEAMHARANSGRPTHCYTQNTLLDIPRRPTEEEDNKLLLSLGRSIVRITADADAYAGAERDAFIAARLEALEQSLQ